VGAAYPVEGRADLMALEVGDNAPDLTLKDQNNQEWTLSEFRGTKNVLLVFYPLAFSGICTGELDQIRDDLDAYQNADVQVMAVSVDSVFTLKAWSEQKGYDFPLLSDFWPHGKVAQDYGVFNDTAGIANRGTVLVDTDGTIRFAEMNQPGEPRDQTVWKKALAALPA
jgi:peroxiredoxin (alkyl hydroperoxide reductase subunit C)